MNEQENKLPKKRRITDEEISLIENTFKGQEQLLITLRKFILQGELSKAEQDDMARLKSPEVVRIIKKTVWPSLDKGAPLAQIVDVYSNMDLHPTPKDHALLMIKARKKADRFMTSRLNALEGKPDQDEIQFDSLLEDKESDEDTYTDFLARNYILSFLDTHGLMQLHLLANTNKTPEEMVMELKRKSTK